MNFPFRVLQTCKPPLIFRSDNFEPSADGGSILGNYESFDLLARFYHVLFRANRRPGDLSICERPNDGAGLIGVFLKQRSKGNRAKSTWKKSFRRAKPFLAWVSPSLFSKV